MNAVLRAIVGGRRASERSTRQPPERAHPVEPTGHGHAVDEDAIGASAAPPPETHAGASLFVAARLLRDPSSAPPATRPYWLRRT